MASHWPARTIGDDTDIIDYREGNEPPRASCRGRTPGNVTLKRMTAPLGSSSGTLTWTAPRRRAAHVAHHRRRKRRGSGAVHHQQRLAAKYGVGELKGKHVWC
jgi:hypothetical protein